MYVHVALSVKGKGGRKEGRYVCMYDTEVGLLFSSRHRTEMHILTSLQLSHYFWVRVSSNEHLPHIPKKKNWGLVSVLGHSFRASQGLA